jgi:hypothetical protein
VKVKLKCVSSWLCLLRYYDARSAKHQYTTYIRTGAMAQLVEIAGSIPDEGSRRFRLSDFKKSANENGKVVSPTHRPPLLPVNITGTHFC